MTSLDFNVNVPVFAPHPKDSRFDDKTGRVYARLTVLGYMGTIINHARWYCRCECGNTVTVCGSSLSRGVTKSCGCYMREKSRQKATHGMSKSPEYRSFNLAKQRCQNPDNQNYTDYGGRGIQFLYQNFQQFISELGPRPSKKHTLDRKDVNGHYEPGNVKWATMTEQNNNKRNSLLITVRGVSKTAAEWFPDDPTRAKNLRRRVQRGWCTICATETPNGIHFGKRPLCSHGGHPSDNG